jgi:hypothetical protein
MIRLVVTFGLSGRTEDMNTNENDELQQVAIRLQARMGLGPFTCIHFVNEGGQMLNMGVSILDLGLTDGERVTAVMAMNYNFRWHLEDNPGPFAYPCACGERWCADDQLCGPNLLLNFAAMEPVARPGKKTCGGDILRAIPSAYWSILAWGPDPHFEQGDIFEKRQQYLDEFKRNVADSIVWQCFECDKVAWCATAGCRPGSSLDRPWSLSRRSKHTRCFECNEAMLAECPEARARRDYEIRVRREVLQTRPF